MATSDPCRSGSCHGKDKNTYLSAQYRRIAARRGKERVLIALGHTIVIFMYQFLSNTQPYQELGGSYFDELERERVEPRLVRRLQRLGYQVSLHAASAPPG